MDLSLIARVLHVLAVILWIGGVGFVTLVLLPALRPQAGRADWLDKFILLENRFAWLARSNWLSRKEKPPTMARTRPVCGSMTTRPPRS